MKSVNFSSKQKSNLFSVHRFKHDDDDDGLYEWETVWYTVNSKLDDRNVKAFIIQLLWLSTV